MTEPTSNPGFGAIVAFDPGASRTGIAVSDTDCSIYCLSRSPWEAVIWLEAQPPDSIGLVILEQWVPYPHARAGNAWRDLVEVKTLGCLEWHCKKTGIDYVYQQTKLLVPTQAAAKAAGYEWRAENRDEKAAETHLYYYMNLSNKRGS